ncbi:hypothetical protein Tco_0520166 [Tanacetum coccineum]
MRIHTVMPPRAPVPRVPSPRVSGSPQAPPTSHIDGITLQNIWHELKEMKESMKLYEDMPDIDFDSRGWLNEEQTPYFEIHVFGSLAPQGDTFTKLTQHQTPTVYGNHETSTPLPDPYQTPLVQNHVFCSVVYPVHMVTDDAPKEKQVRVKKKGMWLQPPFIQIPNHCSHQ